MKDSSGEDRIKELFSSPERSDREQGLVEMHRMYQYKVPGYLRRWTSGWKVPASQGDLDDLWQETFRSMIEMLIGEDYKYDGCIGAMLLRIARCRAADLVRDRMKRPESHPIEPDAVMDLRVQSPDERLKETSLLVEIRNCVERMPEPIRVVLLTDVALFVKYGEWASLKELCSELQLPMTTVKSRRSRGRAQIRTWLDAKGYEQKGKGNNG